MYYTNYNKITKKKCGNKTPTKHPQKNVKINIFFLYIGLAILC